MNWNELIGKKVVALRGFRLGSRASKKSVKLQYILFNDKKTFIELEEQDPYTYHDCSSSARQLTLTQNPKFWKSLFDKDGYDEPGILADPF